jgi:potassium-transporting ATPase KdpC subunit
MKENIFKRLINAFLIMFVFTVILGIVYPFAVMSVGKLFFPAQANGSLIEKNGKIIGSKLIQQEFKSAKYFHGRSASISPNDYPTSSEMCTELKNRAGVVQKMNNMINQPVPVCLITDSGSSLDPDISPEAAYYQANRISFERNISVNVVNKLIAENISYRIFGILGENRVNVLQLNMALDNYCG